ncbi:MAG: ThiF family adenylyltransferase [Treponema phagedenis]|uniref:tRNA threonylcarbamoyladenosine dehydratase n=1 Tax=Treponema phagedenis TaxID=162 RepID=UPI003133FD5E
MSSLPDNPLFSRSSTLLGGERGVERLRSLRVAVFGVGGVGGYTVEALARAGVGTLHLIDGDTVSPSNLNRQLFALHSTIGQYKTTAAAARIADINPACTVHQTVRHILPAPDGSLSFLPFLSDIDCIVDAADTVSLKAALAAEAERRGIPLISAMGCGNKLRADMLEFADIYQTSVCPLCKALRSILKKQGIRHLRVLYSREVPAVRSRPPCSVSWVPAAAGILIAGDLINRMLHGRYPTSV